MTDGDIVKRLRRIDHLQAQLTDILSEIQESDHTHAVEMGDALYAQCWFAASAQHVAIDFLDQSRWALKHTNGGFFGSIISRQVARKKGIRVVNEDA